MAAATLPDSAAVGGEGVRDRVLAGGGRKQWRQTATYTRVRAEGCYAYQIDGTTFSRVVVFRAAP